MSMIEITKDNFQQEVLESEQTVLADFNAGWCGPCKMLKPILQEIAESNPGFKIVSINIDDEDELADDYDVTSIPCLIVFKGGKEVNRSVGLIPKDAVLDLVKG